MVGRTGGESGRGLGSLDPSWAEAGIGRPTPHQVTATPSGQLLQSPSHPSLHDGSRMVSQTQAMLTSVLGS